MKERKKTISNGGFTFIELLVGLAITSLIMVAVTGFMVVGVNSYRSSEASVTSQNEVQIAFNQIASWITETNHGIRIWDNNESVEYTKALVLYNKEETLAESVIHVVFWQEEEQTLYYSKQYAGDEFTGTKEQIEQLASRMKTEGSFDKKYLMCQSISNFVVGLEEIEKNLVTLEISGKNGTKSFPLKRKILLRNETVSTPEQYE